MKEKLLERVEHWKSEVAYAQDQLDFYESKLEEVEEQTFLGHQVVVVEETKTTPEPTPDVAFEFVQNPLYIWAWDRKEKTI